MKNHCRFCFFSALLFLAVTLILSGCKTSPPTAPADTPPTVAITSPANNEVCRLTDTVYVDASDDKGVTKVELYANGALAGTDQSAPWRFIWNTEQWDDGSYTLQAKAYDAAGHSTTSASVTITIRNAFPVTFINTTYTTMSVTVFGVTQTTQPNDSSTFVLSTNPRSLVFNASTSGKTSGGSVVGLLLSWGGQSNPIDVSSYVNARVSLQVPSTYFFMYMTNTGKTTLGPVYVNYGLTDQTIDRIAVPGDGIKYSIGYYKAHSNAIVRAYWSSPTTSYSYWTLSFSFTVNQSQWLTNSYPVSKIAGGIPESQPQIQAGIIQPSPTVVDQKKYRFTAPNTIVVYSHE